MCICMRLYLLLEEDLCKRRLITTKKPLKAAKTCLACLNSEPLKLSSRKFKFILGNPWHEANLICIYIHWVTVQLKNDIYFNTEQIKYGARMV